MQATQLMVLKGSECLPRLAKSEGEGCECSWRMIEWDGGQSGSMRLHSKQSQVSLHSELTTESPAASAVPILGPGTQRKLLPATCPGADIDSGFCTLLDFGLLVPRSACWELEGGVNSDQNDLFLKVIQDKGREN
jgi:hypothetical protein